MALSAGDDVAIVLVALAVLLSFCAVGLFITKRAYRRSEEKQRVLLATREMELDFDTSDIESGMHNLGKGHSRSWSDDSNIPLIRVGHTQWTPSLSKTSFDSDIQSVSTFAFLAKDRPLSTEPMPVQHTLDEVPYDWEMLRQSPIPVPESPGPPLKAAEPPAADHHIDKLVARPSFLTRPRPAPLPGTRRSRSRNAADMRSALLSRLASTRSAPQGPSDEVNEAEPDSPSSVYSQASAMQYDFDERANSSSDVPPVPPIPARFQNLHTYAFVDGAQSQGPSTNASQLPRGAARLEESVVFPLPILPDENQLNVPLKSPSGKWFPGVWDSSPSSTSPSPSHSPSDRPFITPADGAIVSVRSTEVQSNIPQYNVAEAGGEAERGMVGYQLPSNWRNNQGPALVSLPNLFDAYEPSTMPVPTSLGVA